MTSEDDLPDFLTRFESLGELSPKIFLNGFAFESSEELSWVLPFSSVFFERGVVSFVLLSLTRRSISASRIRRHQLYKARRQIALPWGFFPFNVFKRK